MSIVTDLRSYADNAVKQGKHVTEQTRENVSEIAGKATSAVNDLRVSAEKVLNVDAVKTAVEPYLAQVKDYTHLVTDKAEELYATVKSDKRVAKLVGTAETVVFTVQERVVKPVQSLTGRGAKPAPRRAPKAAATRPASKPATQSASQSASKPATSKPAARKAPAKRTGQV